MILKYTLGYIYIGESPEHCFFFGPNMAFSQLVDILNTNTKGLISPEQGFVGSNFVYYICFVGI